MSKELRDITPPNRRNYWPKIKIDQETRISKFFLIAGLIFLIFSAFLVFSFFSFKNRAKTAATNIVQDFKGAGAYLGQFDFPNAKQSLESARKEIQGLDSQSGSFGLKTVDEIRTAFNNLSLFSKKAVDFGQKLIDLSNNGFHWVVNQEGEKLLENLGGLKDDLHQMALLSDGLQNQSVQSGYQFSGDYLDILADLYNSERFLDALISWLKFNPIQYFLVLFQNSSEIRPAGGFIGSYAVLTLRNGGLANIDVRDIYDPDGQLDLKVVPPKSLQFITTRWGARDANWFFDFPLSARKVSDFLEASKIYKERGITFGGVIAINVEAIRDLLEVIGPLNLPDYNLEINSENFLPEIQREVESGADKKAGQPKKILKVLTPMIFEKLGNLNGEGKQLLASKLSRRLKSKDIMVYFKDLAIESYLKTLGVAGDMFKLPNNFFGDYLAVVNTNIAGGKSDAFIEQKIILESEIENDGRIINHLTIERRHNGQNQPEWWYRSTNKDFVQIILPFGSKIFGIWGNEWRPNTPPINYKANNYIVDPDVAAIESSERFLREFQVNEGTFLDKTILSTWFLVKAGESKQLKIDYYGAAPIILKDGQVYNFIFERQSGVGGEFDLSIKAPLGYIWRETGKKTFRFSTNDLPARLILKTTLAQAEDPQLP